MRKENELLSGFTEVETKKIETNLTRLLPHLVEEEFVIVGGLAIRYHLLSRSLSYPDRPFNDLDIIVKKPITVKPSVTKDFLVAHYHKKDADSAYLYLVDPISKTKVDIFDFAEAPESTTRIRFGTYNIDLVSVEDQLVKSTVDISRVTDPNQVAVDPKQLYDARRLFSIADMVIANRLWTNKYKKLFNKTLETTLVAAEEEARKHPDRVKKNPFRKPRPYVCNECSQSSTFPLTPMVEIYKTLEYIE